MTHPESFKLFAVLFSSLLFSFQSVAGFNEATKAYIFGDFETARYEALVGAEDGSAEAQMLLGQLYYRGEGVEKDLQLAAYWYEKAAQQGLKDAQFIVGNMYYSGDGVNKNFKKAKQWLSEAAKNGNREAPDLIDTLYETQSGEVINLTESISYLEKTAESGVLAAQYLFGDYLVKGEKVTQDKARGVSFITQSAKQGFIKSQKRLGELYALGDGVTQNYHESYAWSMAYAGTKELGGLSRVGVSTARASLKRVPEEQIDLAYAKSKEYFEKYVLPFHPNARPVGPEDYRVVLYNKAPAKTKAELKPAAAQSPAVTQSPAVGTVPGGTSSVDKKSGSTDQSTEKPSPQQRNSVTQDPATSAQNNQQPQASQSVEQNNSQQSGNNTGEVSAKPTTTTDVESIAMVSTPPVGESSATMPGGVDVAPEPERKLDSILAVLDAHRPKIFDMYNQAHDAQPSLAGRIELELTIEPQGNVSSLKILNSELEEGEVFEQQLVEYIKNIDFGPQSVKQTAYTYPLVFQR